MDEIPEGMLQRQRMPIEHFDPEELLYRRLMPGAVVNGQVTLDSIELPDMSVNRDSLGPPEWVLLADGGFPDWGIAKFQVKDVPGEMVHLGVIRFTFRVVHKPERKNYPHSEIRAFEDGVHIDGKQRMLDPELHLRWRYNS
jgi:hypothetical protein